MAQTSGIRPHPKSPKRVLWQPRGSGSLLNLAERLPFRLDHGEVGSGAGEEGGGEGLPPGWRERSYPEGMGYYGL